MFDDLKKAWRDAVENFRRELDPENYGRDAARRAKAMRRDADAARTELGRLEAELASTRRRLAEEREAESNCRRREGLARGIGDEETARIAADFAGRHAERAAVFEQKMRAVEAEIVLLRKEIAAMDEALAKIPPTETTPLRDPEPDRDDAEFQRLEQEARERAAEARLEELKRRMR